MQTCKVITKGAGLLRESRFSTDTPTADLRTTSVNAARGDHRARIYELTNNKRLAVTSDILVVSVEVIDFEPKVGDTVASLWGDAA